MVTERVSSQRLMALIDDLARFGARPDGGVDRQALTESDIAARVFLVQRARALGCQVTRDPVGNVFIRREGQETDGPVATGSHIDTQPAGGKLDGAYGVCAGLEAIGAFNDAGLVTRYPVEVVVWANEEGCRFAPGSLGSQVHARPVLLNTLSAVRDASGVAYADCLADLDMALKDVPMQNLGIPIRAFIEAHIEQGPVLESSSIPIGIVTAVQGVRWFRVVAYGDAAHAGTTPLRHRHDALRALVPLMDALYAAAERDEALRITIGSASVTPGSINTIPAGATISVDMRHAEAIQLDAVEATIRHWCALPRYGCRVEYEQLMALPTTIFDITIADALRRSAGAAGLAWMNITSGAFHDAVHVASTCPAAMLFVPSRDGVSHNPSEHTDPHLLVDGARVLAGALAELAEPVRRVADYART